MHERSFRRCCHCNRKIAMDHGLGEWNLQRHEDTCLDQQARERARVARVASRQYRRHVAKSDDVVPGIGQLGFPGFDGVLAEVIA